MYDDVLTMCRVAHPAACSDAEAEIDLPTGTVTFLFTDIEGSTRLLEAAPDAYRAALARHDAIVRVAVAAHGGVTFQNRGDGFCAAFASPANAALAAYDAQRALVAEPWPASSRIASRMGLHTGPVEIEHGAYFGAALNRVARLMDSAHGGQVVLSAATATLLRDVLPPGIALRDLGVHRLRDMADAERIHQLVADRLPTDFPPLRTARTSPHTLPPQVTAFIGRQQALQAVQGHLRHPDVRLLTLTGPGGTGKTRLAIQAAAELDDEFPDGMYFVPLASVTDPELVPSAIAQALDVRELGGRSFLATVSDAVSQKRLLLVLDNFEQVLDAAPVVATLLRVAPGLKIVVTSRAVLRLYGEREYPVPPLTLPDHRLNPSAVHLAQFEAVRLFVDRAQDARPDFTLDENNAAAVADICHRLDGLPLAIELAAARIRALTPQLMLQRMERRLPLLTGGARDLPARQRTLRDAIGWSYDLLDPDEQALFRRLAVFRGCTLEAAEAVCAGAPPRPGAMSVALPPLETLVLDGIESLVEKSLLLQEPTSDGQPWFRMLETIREYALERMEASGESEAIHRRQILSALQLVERSQPALYGPNQASWLVQLEREHDNIRTALRWATQHGFAEPALRLAVALLGFWLTHGHVSEGREWIDELLLRFPPRATSPRASLTARALFTGAMMASVQGDLLRARALHEQALAIRRAIGDTMGIFASLEGLGQTANLLGDHDTARALIEEAIVIAQQHGDVAGEASAEWNLGMVSYELGDFRQARVHYERVTHLVGDRDGTPEIVNARTTLALLAQEEGKFDEAESLASQALASYQSQGNRRLEVLAMSTLAGVSLARGDLSAARERLHASLSIGQELGDVTSVVQLLDRFVALASEVGQHAVAIVLAVAATALREPFGVPRTPSGQQKLDRSVARARQILGEDAADAACQDGRTLTYEEAIAVARSIEVVYTLAGPEDAEAPSVRDSALSPLSRREQEVAQQVARGLTNRQIAEALVISEGTVANHVNHILTKLDFTSRAQIAAWAVARTQV